MNQGKILTTSEDIIQSLRIANYGCWVGFKQILFNANKYGIKLKVDGYSGKDIIKRILSEEKYAPIFKGKTYYPNAKALYQGSVQHGIDHNLRVSILAAFIGIEAGLSEEDFKIILDGALYHDIGRVNDDEDSNHGVEATKKLDDLKLGYAENEMKILKFIIESHCVDDKKIQEVIKKYNFSDSEQKRAMILVNILKDADALDLARMRGVDPKLLRTETAKKLLGAAYELVANINSFNTQDTYKDRWVSLDELINQSDNIYQSNKNAYSNKQLQNESYKSMLQRGRSRFVSFIKKFENELNQGKIAHRLESESVSSRNFDKKIEICGKQYTIEELRKLFANQDSRDNIDEYIKAIQSDPPQITISLDKTGKVVIKEGTLIQGMRRYNEDALEEISKYGLICHRLLSKEHQKTSLTEDCTDVFKVEQTMPIQSYFEDYSTLEYVSSPHSSKQGGQNNERDGKNYTREYGLNFRMKDEASFLPSWISPGIAFIIDPENAKRLKKQSIPEHKRGCKVPFAISPTWIAGLMILQEHEQYLEHLKKIFPNQYIVSTDGTLLYQPQRAETKEVADINPTQENKQPLYWLKKSETTGMMMRFGISDIKAVNNEIKAQINMLKEKDEQENLR